MTTPWTALFDKIDYGSLPDWLAGLGAVGALVAAISAVKYAKWTYENQAAELRTLLDERKREQASKVAAWTFTKDGAPQYRVANTSGLPIYMVELWVMGAGVIGPICAMPLPFIPPGESTIPVPRSHKIPTGETDQAFAGIAFQDAAGLRWKRDAWGNLEEITLQELDKLARSLNGK